jgi:hypothetical protein
MLRLDGRSPFSNWDVQYAVVLTLTGTFNRNGERSLLVTSAAVRVVK